MTTDHKPTIEELLALADRPRPLPVLVMDEAEALRATADLPDWALVSIRGDGRPPLVLGQHRFNINFGRQLAGMHYPGVKPDSPIPFNGPQLHLQFDDWDKASTTNWNGPQRHHADQLITFARSPEVMAASGVIVHCQAGLSRSAASVVVLLAAWGVNPDRIPDELEACRRATRDLGYRDESGVHPNLRLVALGDLALDLRWSLLRAIIDVYPQHGRTFDFYCTDAWE